MGYTKKAPSFMPEAFSYHPVRKMGLEPTRQRSHKILSLARLPIPTLPRTLVLSGFLLTARDDFYILSNAWT